MISYTSTTFVALITHSREFTSLINSGRLNYIIDFSLYIIVTPAPDVGVADGLFAAASPTSTRGLLHVHNSLQVVGEAWHLRIASCSYFSPSCW